MLNDDSDGKSYVEAADDKEISKEKLAVNHFLWFVAIVLSCAVAISFFM